MPRDTFRGTPCRASITTWPRAWSTRSIARGRKATASSICAGAASRSGRSGNCASRSTTIAPGAAADTPCSDRNEIDRSRPEGDRIVNLRWRGKPLGPERELRIAINNYRAGGSGGYTMFRGAKVVWRSREDIRDLLIRYYTERHSIPGEATGNWKMVR